jgi:hypothetical protein
MSEFVNLSSQYTAPRRGTRELLQLYRESPWLRAIVGKIARAVAEVDWLIYAKPAPGTSLDQKYLPLGRTADKSPETRSAYIQRALDTSELKRIPMHPLLELLARGTGNPRLSGFGVFAVTQEHLDLVGEAYWLVEKGVLGEPVALWPLPPAWVSMMPSEEEPYYQISAPGGVLVRVPMTMVVPFIDPDPENPYGRGTGTAHALSDEIQVDEYAAGHMKSFFLNRARPDLIISGQFINPKDAERLETQWKADHQGFFKAYKPIFFSQKIDVTQLNQDFASMQMVQVRKAERDTFINVFGIPPEKIGVIGESKRSTIAASDFFWTKDIVTPRLEAFRRAMQEVLVPMFDDRILLEYETPIVQDDEFKWKVMNTAPWAFRLNEWRKFGAEKSMGPAGDVLVMPKAVSVVDAQQDVKKLDKPEAPPPAPNAPSGTGKPGEKPAEEPPPDEGKFYEFASQVAQEVSHSVAGLLDDLQNRNTVKWPASPPSSSTS